MSVGSTPAAPVLVKKYKWRPVLRAKISQFTPLASYSLISVPPLPNLSLRFLNSHGNFIPHINTNLFPASSFVASSIFAYKNRKKFRRPLPISFMPILITQLKFLEYLTNRQITIITQPHLPTALSTDDLTRLRLWLPKLLNFRKIFGKYFNLKDTLFILTLTLKLKDAPLLIQWFSYVFKTISFWKYRLIFHFLRYLFRYFFVGVFNELGVVGIKFRLKGKISVAGNARTRSLNLTIGKASSSSKNLRVIHQSILVPSFTGVMAFQIWLVF